MKFKLTFSLRIVRPEARATREVVVVVTEAVEDSVAEAEEAVVVIEVVEVVEGEVEEDEGDTAQAQGVKSGSLQVRMLSRSDRPAQMASSIFSYYVVCTHLMQLFRVSSIVR
jgi:flavin-binding protein dodecin